MQGFAFSAFIAASPCIDLSICGFSFALTAKFSFVSYITLRVSSSKTSWIFKTLINRGGVSCIPPKAFANNYINTSKACGVFQAWLALSILDWIIRVISSKARNAFSVLLNFSWKALSKIYFKIRSQRGGGIWGKLEHRLLIWLWDEIYAWKCIYTWFSSYFGITREFKL